MIKHLRNEENFEISKGNDKKIQNSHSPHRQTVIPFGKIAGTYYYNICAAIIIPAAKLPILLFANNTFQQTRF